MSNIKHIDKLDSLNTGRNKINEFAIDPANRAEANSIDAKNVANQSNQTSNDAKDIAVNTDDRLDNIIAGEMQDAEVIDARKPFGGEAYPNLGKRLDEQIGLLNVSDNIGKNEINPDNLQVMHENLTDSQLLQRAIDFCESNNRDYSIRLGRFYEIDTPLKIGKNRPFLYIDGAGGGLINKQDDYMFSGRTDTWSGGLYFKNVKFKEGTSNHPLVDAGGKGKIIQIIADGCSFSKTPTFVYSEEFVQTVRVVNCDLINITDYFLIAKNVYDIKFDNFLHEASFGGLIKLTEESTSNYCAMSLSIQSGVIEGITGQVPISTTHLLRSSFKDLYFEGNTYTDIDISKGIKEHVGVTITDCFFGDTKETNNKKACVKIGKLYTDDFSYNLSSNSSTNMPIFDFSETHRQVSLNLSNCMNISNGPIYFKNDDLMTNINKGTKSLRGADLSGLDFNIKINDFFENIIENEFYISAQWKRLGSVIYRNKFVGFLVVKSGYENGGLKLKVEFRSLMSYTNTNFNDDSTVQLGVVWKSTNTQFRPVASNFERISDTIIIKNLSDTKTEAYKCSYFLVKDLIGFR